jgi:hypothetical protein
MQHLLYFLLDTLLCGAISRSRKRNRVRPEFESLRARIIRGSDIDNLPVELNRLRGFLIAQQLTKHRNIRAFYTKWLTHMNVASGVPVANAYSGQQAKDLKFQLSRIEL